MTRDPADLIPLVYDELRALAAHHLANERPGHTLQATALAHEAYMRLARLDRIRFQGERDFLVAASGAIRRVLVDHARTKNAVKRGGGQARERVTLSGLPEQAPEECVDLLALDEALEKLAGHDARKARVAELRYFGGLTIAETAASLSVSTSTVENEWAMARAWLHRELSRS